MKSKKASKVVYTSILLISVAVLIWFLVEHNMEYTYIGKYISLEEYVCYGGTLEKLTYKEYQVSGRFASENPNYYSIAYLRPSEDKSK